jgi:hypothetical protein
VEVGERIPRNDLAGDPSSDDARLEAKKPKQNAIILVYN